MKVIDLLNKIANGEEIPQLIKWNGYVYDKLGCEYYMLNDRDITLFGDILDTNGKYLNDEVEIIEEDKKIKKIEKLYKYIDKEVDEKEKDMYYENILKVYDGGEYEIDESMSFVVDKINEIIDYLEEKE